MTTRRPASVLRRRTESTPPNPARSIPPAPACSRTTPAQYCAPESPWPSHRPRTCPSRPQQSTRPSPPSARPPPESRPRRPHPQIPALRNSRQAAPAIPSPHPVREQAETEPRQPRARQADRRQPPAVRACAQRDHRRQSRGKHLQAKRQRSAEPGGIRAVKMYPIGKERRRAQPVPMRCRRPNEWAGPPAIPSTKSRISTKTIADIPTAHSVASIACAASASAPAPGGSAQAGRRQRHQHDADQTEQQVHRCSFCISVYPRVSNRHAQDLHAKSGSPQTQPHRRARATSPGPREPGKIRKEAAGSRPASRSLLLFALGSETDR
jgi:hypothetical protein